MVSLNSRMLLHTRYSLKKTNKIFILTAVFVVLSFAFLASHHPKAQEVLSKNHVYNYLKSYGSEINSSPSDDVITYLKQEKNISESYHIFKDDISGNELLDFDRSHIKYIYPETIDAIYNWTDKDAVDWSKYAYVLYATSSHHVCNAMMILAELRNFNTRADLVMLVKKEFLTNPDEFKHEYETLTKFAKDYNVILKPTQVIQIGESEGSIWLSSFTKLMVFNQTEYDRIIYMDSDGVLTKRNMDELFFIPPSHIAVSSAYWLSKATMDEMGVENLRKKYDPEKYGFQPLTAKKRYFKVMHWVYNHVLNFINPMTKKLSTFKESKDPESKLKTMVNRKNFLTNVYNNLPDYPATDEFYLSDIMMVIQPSPELFKRVEESIRNRKENEWDMDLVKDHLFPLTGVLNKQKAASFEVEPNTPFSQRLEEIPEIIILPHQVYQTITPELNSETDHVSYMAEAHEQAFALLGLKTKSGRPAYYEINDMENAGDYMLKSMNYIHFSDAPIPKPWFVAKPEKDYMEFRTRCPSHPDMADSDVEAKGRRRPKYETKDCSNGKNWEAVRSLFAKIRKDVCGLDLIDTDKDTYYELIN